jgi:hypothetical protein
MTDEKLPLPDRFEVTQGRMSAAHTAADTVEVERIRRHLVAEGSTDATEATHLDAVSHASLLAKKMIEAQRLGDDARAGALRRRVAAEFPPGVVSTVLGAMLFTAGREQGWLHKDAHDQLTAFTAGVGP